MDASITDAASAAGGLLGGLGVVLAAVTYGLDRKRERRGKEVEELQLFRASLQDMAELSIDPQAPDPYGEVDFHMKQLGRRAHLGYRFVSRKNRQAMQRISDVSYGWFATIDANDRPERHAQLDAFLDDMGRYLSAAVDPSWFTKRPSVPLLPPWGWRDPERSQASTSDRDH